MGYTNFGVFMIQCNKCSRGWSLSTNDLEKPIITCQDPECKSQFTIYEGIKNGLKKVDDHISPNIFLANNIYDDIIKIKIGYTKYVKFPENFKKIYKIMVFPMESGFVVGSVELTNNGCTIMTSLTENSDKTLIGNESTVMIMVHAKTEDYSIPWLHMLQYALDQFRSGEFLTSILLSEIAFETYIDTTLTLGYLNVGLDKDSISRLLVATELPIKVNPLMNNLFGVKLASASSWKVWEKKVLRWRNEIAHGTKVNANKEEALLVYETVVDSIFHYIEGVDNYLREQGNTSELFFQSK